MKLVFIFLLSGVCFVSNAQIVLKGKTSDFGGKTISVFEYNDFFTRKRKEKISQVISAQGEFVINYPCEKPVYIDIFLNGLYSGIYVQPGFTYELQFNERGKVMSIVSEDSTNEILSLFENRKDAYFKRNKGKSFYKNLNQFIKHEKLVADSASAFAQEVLRYRIADIEFMLYIEKGDTVASNRLESDVLIHNSINNRIPDYFSFLRSYSYNRAKLLYLRRSSYNFKDHVKSLLKEVMFIRSDSVQQLAALAIVRKAYRSEWSSSKLRLDFIADSIYQYATHPLVKQVAANVKRDGNSLYKGNVIDDFSFVDQTGEHQKLSSFKGKYVLIDFWFIACGSCIQNFPKLRKLKQLNSDKLEIISLTPQDTQEKVASFLNKHPDYNWLFSAIDIDDDVMQYFNVMFFPTYILVDPDGKLVQTIGSEEMEKDFQLVANLIK